MHSSKEELLAALEALAGTKMTVVGDLILDRYIWGKVSRISPEAPVPVVNVNDVDQRLGGAANVVLNLRNLGVDVGICAIVGSDLEGTAIRNLLDEIGAVHEGVLEDSSRPTSVKTRVIAQRQQVVRVDYEEVNEISAELQTKLNAAIEKEIARSDGTIISDYAKGVVTAPLMGLFSKAKKSGQTGLGKHVVMLDPRNAPCDFYQGVTVVKPNRKEAEVATDMLIQGLEDAKVAATRIEESWGADLVVITLGEDGMFIHKKGDADGITLDTYAREVFDVSGAGDTTAAVFNAALASGAEPRVAGDLANIAAGAVVSEVGTFAIGQERLREEIETRFLLCD